MKVLHLNTSDSYGGAARAAFRLHKSLQKIGIDSMMLVQDKQNDDNSVFGPTTNAGKILGKFKPYMDRIPLLAYPKRRQSPYHLQWMPDFLSGKIIDHNPDIVHLHWICGGFVNIKTLAYIKKPIVWTFHDMWAFTGGCHISNDCGNYRQSCGKCPHLGSQRSHDLSRIVWKRKKRAWQDINLTVVTPSLWLKEYAQSSSLLQKTSINVIPNGLDLQKYKPMDHSVVRKILNLPEDKKIILFGGIKPTKDENKGFKFLMGAVQKLKAMGFGCQAEILIFGTSKPQNAPELGLPVHYLGPLTDDISLALLYAAADVFVMPSIQENLPNTVMEAMACGTPCVAFNIGGIPEMITHRKNGYLVKPFNTDNLAEGIAWVIGETKQWALLSAQARYKVEKSYNISSVAGDFTELYAELLRQSVV